METHLFLVGYPKRKSRPATKRGGLQPKRPMGPVLLSGSLLSAFGLLKRAVSQEGNDSVSDHLTATVERPSQDEYLFGDDAARHPRE